VRKTPNEAINSSTEPKCSGAGDTSKGSTTWTGKGELLDYISFAGFLVNYVSSLLKRIRYRSPVKSPVTPSSPHSEPLTVPNPFEDHEVPITLILGGYSYGSLIASHLPCTEAIQSRFTNPKAGTCESGIILRARSLATQWSKNAEAHAEAEAARNHKQKPLHSDDRLHAHAHTTSIAVGGDENPSRRASRDSRRSMDAVRRGVDRSARRLGLRHHTNSSEESGAHHVPDDDQGNYVPVVKTHYLLISPLLPPVSSFATMFSRPRIHNPKAPRAAEEEEEDRLVKNPTLAVYGDVDFFTSVRKLRKWNHMLASKEGSLFQGVEIAGAGHFWREDGVEARLREVVGSWAGGVAAGHVKE